MIGKTSLSMVRSADHFDRQTGSLPLRIAVFETSDAIATSSKYCHSFKREDAIRATAISDHLAAFRKFAQALFQFGEGNVESAWKMPERKLVFGPYVEHRHQILA